jgi:hypothetical protein
MVKSGSFVKRICAYIGGEWMMTWPGSGAKHGLKALFKGRSFSVRVPVRLARCVKNRQTFTAHGQTRPPAPLFHVATIVSRD